MLALARFHKGLGLLVLVALIWVVSSFVVQDILTDHGFGRAFFLTFFANSLFVVNLPLLYALRYFRAQRRQKAHTHSYSTVTRERSLSASLASVPETGGEGRPDDTGANNNTSSTNAQHAESVEVGDFTSAAPIIPTVASPEPSFSSHLRCTRCMTFWDGPTFVAATRVTPLWFAANFLYNYSLSMTTVTSNTVLSATSGMFTFAIAVYIGQDVFTYWKVAGIVASLAGVTMTALADTIPRPEEQSPAPSMQPSPSAATTPSMGTSPTPSAHGETSDYTFVGDLICLSAAVFYALYTTSIAHFLPSSDSDTVMLFFGYIGFLGLVFLSPVVAIFDFVGVEHIAMISSGVLGLIAIKGLFDNVLSDALWTVALKWTSPTVATIGLSLTIPISIVAELIVRQKSPPLLGWVGAIFMVAGFIACSVRTPAQQQAERHQISSP